jgi:hypothetical protein
MYCTLTREDALAFSRTAHGHKYTHLLTCRIVNATADDFVDLRIDQNVLVKSKFGRLPTRQRGPAYCEAHNKKGLIWGGAPSTKWAELCLLPGHIGDGLVIESAEPLV